MTYPYPDSNTIGSNIYPFYQSISNQTTVGSNIYHFYQSISNQTTVGSNIYPPHPIKKEPCGSIFSRLVIVVGEKEEIRFVLVVLYLSAYFEKTLINFGLC